MILHRKLAARVAFVALTSFALASSSQVPLVAAAGFAASGGGHGGDGGGPEKRVVAGATKDAAADPSGSVTSRPKTGCPYLRSLQASSDTITQADLAPLRGVSDGVARLFYSVSPKTEAPGKESLDLDTISKQRDGGVIEHPGSLSCSPEFPADGATGGAGAAAVRPPRRDPARLPFLLKLLGLDDDVRPLTRADVARVSRLALELDERFFTAKFGSVGAMDSNLVLSNVLPVGEAELAIANLADDAGLIKREELLALLYEDTLSTSAGPAAGKVGVVGLVARLTKGLAARAAMPHVDGEYKKAVAALDKAAAAAKGGSVLDLETGLVSV